MTENNFLISDIYAGLEDISSAVANIEHSLDKMDLSRDRFLERSLNNLINVLEFIPYHDKFMSIILNEIIDYLRELILYTDSNKFINIDTIRNDLDYMLSGIELDSFNA